MLAPFDVYILLFCVCVYVYEFIYVHVNLCMCVCIVCMRLDLKHVSAFDEIEKQFLTEFDYRKEGAALNRGVNK